ncbi:MAG: glycosyltransferase [Ruminococcaceae bacterium]|nr:glycosyltransferase [Oscillospiraceae bacterium]
MNNLAILKAIAICLSVFISIIYLYQGFYLILPRLKKPKKATACKQLRYAVLIAARNEEMVLPHLLDSIRAQDYPAELIDMYVIADNCTDNTAKVAADHGATVFKRFNKKLIGKGYALNHLLAQIKNHIGWEQYDAFMIFDADNLLEPDYFSKINTLPANGYQAFCGYRNTKNYGTNWLTSGYALWYLHESSHLNNSRSILDTGCFVNGTGFGFSRQLLERLGGWHFFTLTEDLEFNNYCASNGIKIGYCNDAILYDEQPLTFGQSWKQRTRWVKGGLQVSFKYVGSVLRGMGHRGWRGYTCFELFSISFWALCFGTAASLFSFFVTACSFPSVPVFVLLWLCLGLCYFGICLLGAYTVAHEWKRIRATTKEKLVSIFTFPLFLATYVPITLCAFVTKCKWDPIAHTVAISAMDLIKEKQETASH